MEKTKVIDTECLEIKGRVRKILETESLKIKERFTERMSYQNGMSRNQR